MVLERAEMLIKEGMEEEFAGILASKVVPILSGTPGVISVQSGRGVENPDKFMLLVTWESMDAHMAFAKSEAFGPFRAALMPYSKGGGMEHFQMR